MGMGPVCRTSLPTGLSEWELGPQHAEWSPIMEFCPFFHLRHVSLSPHFVCSPVFFCVLGRSGMLTSLGCVALCSKCSVRPSVAVSSFT